MHQQRLPGGRPAFCPGPRRRSREAPSWPSVMAPPCAGWNGSRGGRCLRRRHPAQARLCRSLLRGRHHLQQLGELEEAEGILRHGSRRCPAIRAACWPWPICCWRRQAAEEAEPSCAPACRSARRRRCMRRCCSSLGLALRRQNRNEEALEHSTRSAALDPIPSPMRSAPRSCRSSSAMTKHWQLVARPDPARTGKSAMAQISQRTAVSAAPCRLSEIL